MQHVSLIMAFAAGAVSFLSPCVLPLVPSYISFVSGMSFDDLTKGKSRQLKRAAMHAVVFIFGFSAVFISLGASATAIGQFLVSRLDLFTKIGGIIVILLGLHILGIWKIGLLYREKHFIQALPNAGLLGAFVTGLAFAFAWTPCIGPILGAILTFAATQETVNQGVILMAAYSLGLGVPFFVTAIAAHSFLTVFRRVKGYLRAVEVGAGLMVVAMGVLMLTNNVSWLSGQLAFLNRFVW